MRKICLVVILLTTILLTSCNVKITDKTSDSLNENSIDASVDLNDSEIDISVDNDIVKNFLELVNSGAYIDAIEHYNDKILGNYSHEYDAAEKVKSLLLNIDADILSGAKTEADAKKAIAVVDKILDSTNMYIDNYIEIKSSINVSVVSKAAFIAAQELEKLKNYTDAIVEYNKVIVNDSNYLIAQESITRCTSSIKTEGFENASQLVENNDYIAAIAKLKELSAKLPEDEEVLAKITIYEKTYINKTIEEASTAFLTPKDDYSKSVSIINSALQYYPENEELLAKKDYYQSFAPVYLYDMDTLKGSASIKSTDEDIYGNSYDKCFWTGYGNYGIWNDSDISFYLNKEYNEFSATVYCRSKKNDVQYMVVEIYTDGKIAYQKLDIKDNSTAPFEIKIDVTGVSELRINLTRNGGTIGAGIGLSNMTIQKTVR